MKALEVIASTGSADRIRAIAAQHRAQHFFRLDVMVDDGHQPMHVLMQMVAFGG